MIEQGKQLARDFVRHDGWIMVAAVAMGYAALWAGYVFELAEWSGN
jgi:hypothetical protein